MKKQGTIYHVEFHSGGNHYYGSIAAIYEVFSAVSLGVSRSRLYQLNINENKPYTNKICTIRKGTMTRKEGNRKNPIQNKIDSI